MSNRFPISMLMAASIAVLVAAPGMQDLVRDVIGWRLGDAERRGDRPHDRRLGADLEIGIAEKSPSGETGTQKLTVTIRADADTVMSLSNLKIGVLGMPVYYDEVGRGVALKLMRGKLRIDGLLTNIATLNRVTRVFSVQ